ncbi:MAG: hypothetical protein ACKOFE_03650, partial [Bacteroidota bacterium]
MANRNLPIENAPNQDRGKGPVQSLNYQLGKHFQKKLVSDILKSKSLHHQLKIAVLASFLVLTGIYSALTSSGGAPLGHSSSPGDSDCSSCHG